MAEFSENFVVIDLETTGLDPKNCGILEIGAVDASGRLFYRRVKLDRGCRVDWPALECNGIDPVDLGCGGFLFDAVHDLYKWLSAKHGRWILGGKNPQFDYNFLDAVWPDNLTDSPISQVILAAGDNLTDGAISRVISHRFVDLHSILYGPALAKGKDLTALEFSTADLYRGIIKMEPEPKPHNALRGAVHTMEGFRRLLLGMEAATPQEDFEQLMKDTARANLPSRIIADWEIVLGPRNLKAV